jgi:hypothetical protein
MWRGSGSDEKMHSPEDRPDRLSVAGMQQISGMLTKLITALATNPKRPEFRGTGPN